MPGNNNQASGGDLYCQSRNFSPYSVASTGPTLIPGRSAGSHASETCDTSSGAWILMAICCYTDKRGLWGFHKQPYLRVTQRPRLHSVDMVHNGRYHVFHGHHRRLGMPAARVGFEGETRQACATAIWNVGAILMFPGQAVVMVPLTRTALGPFLRRKPLSRMVRQLCRRRPCYQIGRRVIITAAD